MATAQFQGLDFYVTGVSGDGSVVVGYDGPEAVRWTASTGSVDIGPLVHPNQAFATNYDGSVAVGWSYFSFGGATNYSYESVRWDGDVMTYLGFLPGGFAGEGQAKAVSADGSVIVGWARATAGAATPGDRYEAYHWMDGHMTELGFLPGGYRSIGTGVSGDGSVVVGYSLDSVGSSLPQAFVWTAATGMVGLGFLPGATVNASYANGVSADGSVIVGHGSDASGYDEAFRWDDGIMTGLGFLPGPTNSNALATNGDGSVVVGTSADQAFLWDEVFGMQDLQNVLVSEYGLDLAGWNLVAANGISDDGGTIVGDGYAPNGSAEGFVVSGLLVNTFVTGTYTVASGHHDAIGMLGGSGVVEIGLDASLSIGGNNTSSDPVHFPNSVFSGSITGSGDLIKDGTGLWLFTGSFDPTGILSIDNGTVEIAAAFSGNVDFSANSHGFLILDQPKSFTGTVSGLTRGDYIDLTNIDFAHHPVIKYSSKTDQLIVTDPQTRVSDTITLIGDYKKSDFTLTSDGSGGTLITAQVSQPGPQGGLSPVTNSLINSNGPQQDTFVFAPNFGQNTINNFNAHNDTIEFAKSEFAALLADAHQIGVGTIIAHDPHDVITQQNVSLPQFHDGHILLV